MIVSPVSSIGGGGVDPLLAERYAVLNEEIRLKRLAKQRGVDPLIGANHLRVESLGEKQISDNFPKKFTNPLLAQIPIHIAYRILQRICEKYYNHYHDN